MRRPFRLQAVLLSAALVPLLVSTTAGRAAAQQLPDPGIGPRYAAHALAGIADEAGEDETACATPAQLREALKPLSAIGLDVRLPADETPQPCYTASEFALPAHLGPRTRHDSHIGFHWAASGLLHKPLYFEDVPLERHGQTSFPALQPAISGARFVKSALTLPYRMGLQHPHECVYALGYARPGSCAPSLKEHLPWSWKGGLLEAGAVTGFVLMFP